MLSPEYKDTLTRLLGADFAKYVERKRIGGDNGAKGVRYEDYFAAYKLACSLCAKIADCSKQLPHLAQQADAIVDDLVLTWNAAVAHYYQCKNVGTLSWTSGDHPLVDDFIAQASVALHECIGEVKTLLVVPTAPLAMSLAVQIPETISDHSEVINFPYCEGRLNRLVIECVELRGVLAELARVDLPSDDELANVFGALLHGIKANNGFGMSEQMLYGAQGLCPHLIRLMPEQLEAFQLEPGFEEALAKVDEVVYCLSRGFFQWEAMGTSGVFSQNCLSQEFQRFQRRLVQASPSTLDEFEALL